MSGGILIDEQLSAVLAGLPEWQLASGKLCRTWTFADFPKAMAFVNRVAEVAEQANHHPDFDIRYNRVTLGLISHDAGGITSRDVRMARRLQTEFP